MVRLALFIRNSNLGNLKVSEETLIRNLAEEF